MLEDPVVLLLPLLRDLLFELQFLPVVPVVPEDVVLPTEALDPIDDVEDKSKLDKEFRFITLFTREVTVVVEVVVVVVENTPSQGLAFLKFM